MGNLQHNIYEWCGVPPGEQRILCEGLPLPPDIKLSSVDNGTTLMVRRDMHSGIVTLSGGKKEGAATLSNRKKKERGIKKAA